MAITKRDNSKFYYSEFTINGKKFIKSTRSTDKKLAQKIDEQYYSEALEKAKLKGNEISLTDAMDMFEKTKRDNKKYQDQVRGIFNWIRSNFDTSLPMSDVDNLFLHNFVEKRSEESKPATVKHNLGILCGVIKLCRKLGYDTCIVEKPTIKLKNQKTRVLSKDEEERLINELANTKRRGIGPGTIKNVLDLRILVITLIDTACRFSEIAELKWEGVDLENKLLSIWRRKTSTAAVLPMTDRVYELLKDKERTCDYVFPNQLNNGPRRYNSTQIKNALKRAGIEDATFHTTRHTTLSRLAQSGMSIPKIKTVSGHADLASLQRYVHLTTGDVLEEVRTMILPKFHRHPAKRVISEPEESYEKQRSNSHYHCKT